ncbi:MAG: redoxin family protein [Minisyncoccia bacterium]
MSKNKNSSVITAVAIVIVVAALGYFLFKSSPDSSQAKQNVVNNTSANMDGMHGGGAAVNSNTLNSLVGKPMPDIKLADKDGKLYTTADFRGKNTVLFFNEGLMCYPACWNQMAAFGSDERFNSGEIQAISVVVDSAKDWQTAIDKMPQLAKANTMFDTDASASRELGMLSMNSSMHRGSFPGHTYILIDKEGIVKYVFDDPNMAMANDSLYSKIQELSKQ